LQTHSPLIQQLIRSFNQLPGIGKKSATRISYYLLERDKDLARQLAQALINASDKVNHCQSCYTLSEQMVCRVCSDSRRDPSTLCVVGSPADMMAIEQSGSYRGQYFVLMGNLSPLDGIGPKELHLPQMFEKVRNGQFSELILATNTTPEGEVTANYIINELSDLSITVSRIAYGISLGVELEYVDGSTLGHAFKGRKPIP